MSTKKDDVYNLLQRYLHSTSDTSRTILKNKLANIKTSKSPHKLLEHDEYFYNKYDSKTDEEFDGFVLSNNQKFLKQFQMKNLCQIGIPP